MVEFNPELAVVLFVVMAFATTWAKGAGGPFRILFIALVGIPILLGLVASFGTSAPASAVAVLAGAVVGLKT